MVRSLNESSPFCKDFDIVMSSKIQKYEKESWYKRSAPSCPFSWASIYSKPIGHRYSAFLDSRIRGNDEGMFFSRKRLRITYEIKPGISDEKRGNAALLIKNSGFYFQS